MHLHRYQRYFFAIAAVPVVLFLALALADPVDLSINQSDAIDSLVVAKIDGRGFPAAAVAVGNSKATLKVGGYGSLTYDSDVAITSSTQFDLASMTKVVATTTAAMRLYESGALSLDKPVAEYLPAFGSNGKDVITIRQLLSHRSGLVPSRRYDRMGMTTRPEVIDAIMNDTLAYTPGSEYRYSDLGMITLGLVIEEISGMSLADYARKNIFEPLGMTRTEFKPANGIGDTNSVPTEIDETFRMRLVQGEVHDETAYILGGTAGHAGLFSTAEDLGRFARMMLADGELNGLRFLKKSTIDYFTARPENPEDGERGLGWDLKSIEGYSSAGRFFSPSSFGHTGFTGTSIWMDPQNDVFAVLLTNRVYPTRNNRAHIEIRPEFADLAFRFVTSHGDR